MRHYENQISAMGLLFAAAVVVLTVGACSLANTAAEAPQILMDTGALALHDLDDFCSRPGVLAEGFWSPTDKQIARLERRLLAVCLIKAEECFLLGAWASKPRSYSRQYVGVIVGGRELIYINSFSDGIPPGASRSKLSDVCDVGTNWGVLYDPVEGNFFDACVRSPSISGSRYPTRTGTEPRYLETASSRKLGD